MDVQLLQNSRPSDSSNSLAPPLEYHRLPRLLHEAALSAARRRLALSA